MTLTMRSPLEVQGYQWPTDDDCDPRLASLIDSLPGIDATLGRDRMLNSDQLYVQMLKRFRMTRSGFVGEFETALRTGDFHATQNLAHNLCGSAGSIAAVGVERSSRVLERAIYRRALLTEVELAFAAVSIELHVVLEGLSKLL
jgi:HPt (histidine-containing phosphotransfer) domain-containing protein